MQELTVKFNFVTKPFNLTEFCNKVNSNKYILFLKEMFSRPSYNENTYKHTTDPCLESVESSHYYCTNSLGYTLLPTSYLCLSLSKWFTHQVPVSFVI